MGSTPFPAHKTKPLPDGSGFILEQDTGVEPAFTAWEAVVLPIYESCIDGHYSRLGREIQQFFVAGLDLRENSPAGEEVVAFDQIPLFFQQATVKKW